MHVKNPRYHLQQHTNFTINGCHYRLTDNTVDYLETPCSSSRKPIKGIVSLFPVKF